MNRWSSSGSGAEKRTRAVADIFDLYSFLLLGAVAGGAIVAFPHLYAFFVFIVVVDALATFFNSDTFLYVERSFVFVVLLVLLLATGVEDILLLFLEIISILTALDMSFLLRRLRWTVTDWRVLRERLVSYGYTAVPAFIISYSLATFYSTIPAFTPFEALVLLAVSSSAALAVIYRIYRYISSPL